MSNLSDIPEFEEWRNHKLWNWGRWRWHDLMECAPDSSCQNSFWNQMVSTPDDGYGEITEETVVVVQEAPAKAEQEPVDVRDAEHVHGWVAQVAAGHRESLVARYVYRLHVNRDKIDAAIHAILWLKHENRRVVERMRHAHY